MSPIVATVTHPQEEVTICNHQLHSMAEEVGAIKQQTLQTTHPLQTTAVQTTTSPPVFPLLVHHEVKARLHLQSTMQSGCVPEPLTSPASSSIPGDLRGRFMRKSPIKFHVLVELEIARTLSLTRNSIKTIWLRTLSQMRNFSPLCATFCLVSHQSQAVPHHEAGNIYQEGL